MALALVTVATVGTLVTQKMAESATSYSISVGDFPQYTTLVGTKLYAMNRFGNTVSVIDTNTYAVIATVPVGTSPIESTLVGTNLYVANFGAGTVSVIDTTTDTVTATVTVGSQPLTSTLVGTDLYVDNYNANTVSVIDTLTNTVTATITTGGGTKRSVLVGSRLYVTNYGPNTLSIIDTNTKTVIQTVTVCTDPVHIVALGSNIYISCNNATVSVFDTNTNTVTATIPVTYLAGEMAFVGTDLYVTHGNHTFVTVIDTLTNTVTNVITVGGGPVGLYLVGTSLYITNRLTDNVSVIDTVTKTVIATVVVGDLPFDLALVGSYLYISNPSSDNIYIIDTNTNTLVEIGKPLLLSASAAANIVTVTYDENLDAGSVPATSEFALTVDGTPVAITGVVIVGSTVELTLASIPAVGSTVLLDYTAPIAGRVQKPNGNAADSYTDEPVTVMPCNMVSLGSFPWHAAVSGQEVYIASGSNGVSVLDTLTRTISATIPIPPDAVRVIAANNAVYAFDASGYSMHVIDTNSKLVIDTLPLLGGSVSHLRLVGTNLYVYLISWSAPFNRVVIFDTLTNTEITTVSLGSGVVGDFLVGTDLYAVNDTNVSVIDTLTNTITDTIVVGSASRYGALVGTQAYVLSAGSANISVIDTATKTVVDTIPFASNVDDRLFATGTMLYIVSQANDNVTVIDTLTDTVVATIAVGDFPGSALLYQDRLFVMNETSQDISVIDTDTQTLVATIPVYGRPRNAVIAGGFLYTMNLIDSTVSIVDAAATTFVPISCIPPVTHTLLYTAGLNGMISGTAAQTIADGANGTPVTAVPNPGYRFTQWSDASTANPRTDTNVTANLSVTASFVTLANPGSGGSTGCVGQECGDTLGPVISDILVSDITTSSARITWTTSEPSITSLYFGLNDGYGSGHRGNSTLVTSHSVTLSNLAEGATYHFQLEASDSRGNRTASGDNTFDTSTLAQLLESLMISDVEATLITDSTAVITWLTNVPLNSRVDYGLTSAYGNTATNDLNTMSHSVSLSGLLSNTPYHYRVTSGYGTSTVSSEDLVLNTLVAVVPPVNPLNVVAVGQTNQNRLTWQNPDEEDFSRVRVVSRPDRYPTNPADGVIVYEGNAETALHTGLDANQTQFYAVFAYDVLGSRSSGAIAIATTQANAPEPEPEPITPPVVTPSTTPAAPVVPVPTRPTPPNPPQPPVASPSTSTSVEVPPIVVPEPAPDIIPLQPNEEPSEVFVNAALTPMISEPTLIQQFIDAVQSVPVTPEAATAAAAIATAATLASLASVASAFNYLGYLFSQPLMLIGARTRKKWGVVYNSITKQGTKLAVVRLINAETGLVLQTRITDDNGRYFFHVKPGKYRLEATKSEHVFPSAIASGLAEDDEYLDIYHGTPITVENETDLMMNIPIDPNHQDQQDQTVLFKRLKTKVQYGISALSFGITAVALILQPGPVLLGLLLLQVMTYLLFRKLVAVHKPKNWGVVTEVGSSKTLKNAVVRIFDKQYNKLLETQVTDSKGRYGFLANKNRYFVTADKQGYQRYISEEIDLTRAEAQTIERPIGLRKADVVTVVPPSEPMVAAQ